MGNVLTTPDGFSSTLPYRDIDLKILSFFVLVAGIGAAAGVIAEPITQLIAWLRCRGIF